MDGSDLEGVKVLSDLRFLDHVFRLGGLPDDVLSDLVLAFTIDLGAEYSLGEMPRVIDYPATSVRLFNKDNAQEVRDGMVSDWRAVQRGEQLALTNQDMATFMADVHWLEHTLPRLIMALAEHEEEFDATGDNLENIVRACVEKFGDEKIPEDIHQSVRDSARQARHGHLSMGRIHHISHMSGVLEGRGIGAPQGNIETIARSQWYKPAKDDGKALTQTKPSFWPVEMDHILRPRRDWSSPTTEKAFSSTLSFSVLIDWDGGHMDGERLPWEGWWARLSRRHWLLKSRASGACRMVMLTGQYGMLVQLAEEVAGSTVRLAWDSDKDPVEVIPMVYPTDFVVHAFTSARSLEHGILMQLENVEATPFLHKVCANRYVRSKWELQKTLAFLDPGKEHNGSIPKLRSHLLEILFTEQEERAYYEELYKRDVTDSDVGKVDADPELNALLEELAFDDCKHAKGIKDFRADLAKDSSRKLQGRRRDHRAEPFVFTPVDLSTQSDTKAFCTEQWV